MDKPEWKDAPHWANVLVVQCGFNGPLYCWAEDYADGSKAKWHEDLDRPHMVFEILTCCWKFVESRP